MRRDDAVSVRYMLIGATRTHLLNTWWQKIDDACKLPSLSECFPDLTECYEPDAGRLSTELVQQAGSSSMRRLEAFLSTMMPHVGKE